MAENASLGRSKDRQKVRRMRINRARRRASRSRLMPLITARLRFPPNPRIPGYFDFPAEWSSSLSTQFDLHRARLASVFRPSIGFKKCGTLMVSNLVQPRLKPGRSWPSPANLRQLFAVIKSFIHRALAEDGFPSVHDYSLLDINSA
jgi:hypothetical protein